MFDDRPEIQERLDRELVIWMTTVNARGQAQASPVWFIVQDDAIVVFSLEKTPRIKNIAANPQVAMHLNSSETGGDLVIIEAQAGVVPEGRSAAQEPAYLAKYDVEMQSLKMTPDTFTRDYPMRIHVRPTRLRAS